MLNFPKFLKWISGAVCFIFLNSSPAQAVSPTDPAKGFLVVTRGYLDVQGSPHIHGGLAVGGALRLNSGTIDVNMDASGTDTFKDGSESRFIGLIVEGGVTYTSGAAYVHDGRYIKLKNLTDHSKYSSTEKKAADKNVSGWSGPSIQVTTGEQNQSSVDKDVFDFDGAFAEFISHSNTLKALAQNAAFNTSAKTMQNTNSGILNVLSLTKTELGNISGEFKFTNAPSATYPVVINIDLEGSTFAWNHPNFPGLPASSASYIIWNFYNGHLTLQSGDKIWGTIFAPQSNIVKNSANDIEGQVIANNLALKSGQVHVYKYEPEVPVTTECTGCKSVNMIYNPDFGSCPSPSVDGWEIQKSQSSVSWGTFCHSFGGSIGDKSVGQLNWNDVVGANYVRQKVEDGVVPLKSFVYTASAATHHDYYNGQTRVAKLWIEFYNSSDQKIGGNVGEQYVTTAYSTFKTYTISGTIPANAKYLKIVGYANGTALKFTNNLLTIDCYDQIGVTTSKVNANCLDQSGSIAVNTTGGSGQFTYTLKKGSTTVATSPALSSGAKNPQYTFTGLASGTYTVTVADNNTTSGNCKWTSGNIVVAKDPVPATPTGISDKTICTGQSVTLPGACTTGTLKWYQSDKTTVISGTSVSPTSTTTYYARCESTCKSDWASMKVTVSDKPTVSVDNKTICAGESATLTATCSAGTVTWNTGATGMTLTVSPATTTTYTATCKNSSGCEASAGGKVTVNDKPTISVDNKTICAGESATLTASNCTGTVTWNTGATGTTLTVNPTTTTTYTATCKNSSGCEASADGKVTVNDKPIVTINNSGQITCASGSEITATASPSSGVTYIWTVPAGATDPGNVASFTATVAGEYKVRVKLGTTGCESDQKSTTVTEDKTPPTVTVKDGLPLTCANSQRKLSATGSAGVTYSWTGPGGFTATTAEIEVSVAGSYVVTVTAPNGCTATATAKITEDKTKPTVTVNNATLTCTASSVKLTANGSPAGVTYSWTGPGGFTAATKEIDVTAAGSYEVTVTAPNGCTEKATSTVTSDVQKPTVTVNNATLTCTASSVKLTANGSPAGVTYSWTGPGGFTAATKEIDVTAAGSYEVTVTAPNGCTEKATAVVNEDKDVETITATGGTLTCEVNSVTLKATGNAAKYEWSLGGTKVGEGKELSVNVAGIYTVTVTFANGCTTTAQAEVTTDNDKPTVILETGKLTCETEKVTVAAAATGNGITYKWTVPTGATDPGNVASFETSVPGVYTVEVTSANGCKASDQIEVQQDTNVPTVTVGDKIMACGETEVTLTAEGSAGVTYSWTGPEGFTAATKEITVSKAGTYTVTVTAPNGCTATDEGKVTKQDKPEPPLSGPHKVCYGEEVTLAATCASGTVRWYSDAALTQEITTLTFAAQQTHTYYAVCATQDCVSEPTESVVTVTPDFPAPVLTATPEEVIKGESSTLSGSCETGTLVWYKDPALTEVLGTGETLVVTPETTTTYYAACEVEDCKKPSEVVVKVKDQIFDLALRKTIKGGGKNPVVNPGAGITFEIEVFNQGNVAASNIQVTDYIPAGLTLNDADWTAAGGKATLNTKIASLAAGAGTKVEITFTVNTDFTGKAVNAAEISSADGGDDIDSTPDDNPGNDGTPKDDEINEDGKKGGDEDDHDFEEITVEATPVFDLALRKTLKTGQNAVFKPGDNVTFEITVFNQGNVDATDIDLVDYIPTGLTLNDANWTLDGSKAKWTGAIASLEAGAQATVSITFTLNNNAVGPVITNVAEISGAKNDKGLEDIDSTPDDNKDNDGTPKNDEINEDGKKGGDEDDHDIEPITVCPDQKCLTAKIKVKK